MAKLGLSSPWVLYYKKVDAMFKYDDEVHVLYDEDKMELRLYVEDTIKAAALEQLLPTAKGFGNLELKITIIPANDDLPYDAHLKAAYTLPDDPETLFNMAFRDNEVFSYSKTIKFIFDGAPLTYIVFAKEVVQYFDDNLGDINGICSTLYQNIAADIFQPMNGVYYCTDIDNP